jgi:hypothetical protein
MAGQRRGTMKRTLAVAFVGAIVLTTMLMVPGAQAAPTGARSTSCSLVARLKFKPPLDQGLNENAFIKLSLKLRGCSGGLVTSATGMGGSIGDLRCDAGVIRGRAAAKAELFWDTGDQSGLNFFFMFGSPGCAVRSSAASSRTIASRRAASP